MHAQAMRKKQKRLVLPCAAMAHKKQVPCHGEKGNIHPNSTFAPSALLVAEESI